MVHIQREKMTTNFWFHAW